MDLFKSTLSRRTASPISRPKSLQKQPRLCSHKDHYYSRLQKSKHKQNCPSTSRKTIAIGIILLMLWAALCGLILFWNHPFINHPIKYLNRKLSHEPTRLYSKTMDDYTKHNKHIIYTNIAIVIPSYFNQYTIHHIDRILHNIYLSQIDFETVSNSNQTNNNIYFPSETIISMAILPAYYPYIHNITTIITYYHSILNGATSRLQIIYHRNITMNAAQNRNFGLSQINSSITDYVGFFDIDDIMHPQRTAILYHILNGNTNNIDFLFHSFIMHKHCKKHNLKHNYLKDFMQFKAKYYTSEELHLLSKSISDGNVYETDYCVAYYNPKHDALDELRILKIECNNGARKRDLLLNKYSYIELFKFNRYYHYSLKEIAFINYTELIKNRCLNIRNVKHPIGGELYDVDCDYGTMAGGLEAFRNQMALTRHHNGWPTIKVSIAKRLRYDENWSLHGSYRGQDSGFNTDAFHKGAKIFQVGYYLGIYCYH